MGSRSKRASSSNATRYVVQASAGGAWPVHFYKLYQIPTDHRKGRPQVRVLGVHDVIDQTVYGPAHNVVVRVERGRAEPLKCRLDHSGIDRSRPTCVRDGAPSGATEIDPKLLENTARPKIGRDSLADRRVLE